MGSEGKPFENDAETLIEHSRLSDRFGPYTLLRRIARGGMGEIFLAKQSLPRGYERPLIVKRILPHLSDDDQFVEMFLREAHTASRFQHENIVPIYHVGEEDSQYYIAMEYVQGKALRSLLLRVAENGVNIPAEIACYMISCVCKGLYYAHNKTGPGGEPLNLVHRDVSPQNILISYEGGIRLIDFGITKAAGSRSLTHPGTLKGKIPYMSPEQARGEPLDHRSDIFSTGVLLFELLVGEPLFSGTSDYQILEMIRNFSVEEIVQKKMGNLPSSVQKTLVMSLQKEPEKRSREIREMYTDLDHFLVTRNFSNGAAALALLMNRLFSQEMFRESDELSRTRTLASQAEQPEPSQEKDLERINLREPPGKPEPEDKRILKHKLVILVLALIILFESFLFVWRDYQWQQEERKNTMPAKTKSPPASAFP